MPVPTRTTLSAFVCVRNEEARLANCLARLHFCDQIVVVADRCTDRTEAIARECGAEVISGIFPLEGPRRQAGLSACSEDWVLEIDADEEVTPALAAEIRAVLIQPDCDWFSLPVDNFIGGRLVRYGWGGSFGVSAVTRLYRRGGKTWGDQRLHPSTTVSGQGGPRLVTPLLHRVDDDISDMLSRLDRYTRLRAQDLREAEHLPGLWSNAFRGVRRFWKCYVSRKGYREGRWGVLIALCAALYPFLSALRAHLEETPVEQVATAVTVPFTPRPRAAS
jgi:glycosyltransferase involved in cell wall biosynthesis